MTDKQIIDEERMFECVWCKYSFKESDANFILSENPNECICSGCITEWADNLLCDLKRKEQECEKLLKENQQLRNSLSDSLMFKFTGQENETNRYRKALEELEELACCIKDFNFGYDELGIGQDIIAYANDILDIINKTKGGGICQ